MITVKHKIFYSFFPKFSIKNECINIFFLTEIHYSGCQKLFSGGISYYKNLLLHQHGAAAGYKVITYIIQQASRDVHIFP